MKAGSSCQGSACIVRGKWQAPQKSLPGRGIDDERINEEQVSEGNTTKTGGEGPYALLQERGEGRPSFPGCPARPLSRRFSDSTPCRAPEDDPRCNRPHSL